MQVTAGQPYFLNAAPVAALQQPVRLQQAQQQHQLLQINPQQPPQQLSCGVHFHLRSICLEYSYGQLATATEGFHPSRKLGEGSAGTVYRAEMPDGSSAAVKEIDLATPGGAQVGGFEDEVGILSKFRHANLVTLMGWGQMGTRRFLIYEYLPVGDVSQRLQRSKAPGGQAFLWEDRLSVALDAATGLAYLHNATPRAFHRDIKTANILISGVGGAKMADFGLSCVSKPQLIPGTQGIGSSGERMQCRTACGTPGYACPLYSRTGTITEGSEVYSFGVVLFELLLNTPPATIVNGQISYLIWELVHPEHPGALQRAMSHIDPSGQWPPAIAEEVLRLAFRCWNSEDLERPRFNELCRSIRSILERHFSSDSMAASPGVCSKPLVAPVGDAGSCRAAVPGPTGTWRLECIFSSCLSVDAFAEIPGESRTLSFSAPDSPEPRRVAVVVGRQHQPQMFDILLTDKALLSYVSRSHLQIEFEDVVVGHSTGTCNPNASLGVSITNLSQNAVLLNSTSIGQGESRSLCDGDTIGFATHATLVPATGSVRAAGSMGSDELLPLLVFRFIAPVKAPEDRTWQKFAGRASGSAGYQFGDFTRGSVSAVVGWLRSAVDADAEFIDAPRTGGAGR